MDLGEAILVKDSKVYLYTGIPINNKKGGKHYKESLVEEPFRLVIIKSKDNPDKQFWFITNEFKLTAKEISQAYRKR